MPFSRRVVNDSLTKTAKPPRRGLLKSTSVVSSMTFLSRIVGFIRDIILAQFFGVSGAFDAFIIAFKIPNFLRRLFGEGAFSQAFVPVLVECKTTKSHEDVYQFISRVAGTLAVSVSIIIVLAEIAAPLLILVFAPGFLHDAERYQHAVHMLRITFPYILLISLTAFSGAIFNSYQRFAIPAFTPVLLNLSLIFAAWLGCTYAALPIYVLAWGVILGGVLQLALQLPGLYKAGLLPRLQWGWSDPGVRRVMTLMVPALFGVSVAQIGIMIDNIFASFLPTGSISWLYYSDRLTYLPLGVIGVALATVVLPQLAEQHQKAQKDGYSRTLDWALRVILLVGVPAAVGLFVLAAPLMATLIQHGAFTVHDAMMSAQSLRAFAVGLPAFMLVKVLASAFYSQQNIKTPVKIAAAALVVNIVLVLVLIHPLRHAGLALATSLAAFANAGMLLYMLIRYKAYRTLARWPVFFVKLFVANAAMAMIAYYLSGQTAAWFDWSVLTRVEHLFGIICAAVCIYMLMLRLCSIRLTDFKSPEV